MEFTEFKDRIFDLINECDQFDVKDIRTFDRENRYVVEMKNGRTFEIALRALSQPASAAAAEMAEYLNG